MSAPVPGPATSNGAYVWTCGTCHETAPLDAYFQKDAEPKHYLCPTCKTAPQVPCIELHNARTKKNEVFFMPTPKQVEAMLCPARNLLYGGRAGTGKSWWLRMEAYHRCLKVAGFRALILRRHITELRGTHLDKAAIEAKQIGATWRASENTLVFANGSRLRFGHVEDDNAVTNYLSEEYDWIGFDEGATFTEYAVRFISSRLRTTKKGVRPLLRMGSNPGAMWIHRYYIAKDVTADDDPSYNPDDYAFIPASALDNPHVTEEEYNLRLNALPTEALRKMYRDGDWGAVDGQEFTEWKPFTRSETGAVERWHEITELPTVIDPQTMRRVPISEAPWIPVTRVLDWGYSPDPGHVTWFAHLPSGRFIAFKEWSFRETLARDVADGIHERSAGMKIRTSIAGHDLWMKSKETGEELAETFARRRISFQVANTDRVHGWQRLHSLLRETVDEGNGPVPRLQVYIGGDHGPGCTILARTIPMLRQDPKNPGDVLQQDDHAPDTARWFAMDRPAASKGPGKPSAWSRLSADARRRITAASGKGSTLGSESVRRR